MIVESNLYCVTDLTTVRTQRNVNANRLIEMRGLRPKTFIKAGISNWRLTQRLFIQRVAEGQLETSENFLWSTTKIELRSCGNQLETSENFLWSTTFAFSAPAAILLETSENFLWSTTCYQLERRTSRYAELETSEAFLWSTTVSLECRVPLRFETSENLLFTCRIPDSTPVDFILLRVTSQKAGFAR